MVNSMGQPAENLLAGLPCEEVKSENLNLMQ